MVWIKAVGFFPWNTALELKFRIFIFLCITQKQAMSHHLMHPLCRSAALVSATRRRCGTGEKNVCPALVFADVCTFYPRQLVDPATYSSREESACALGCMLEMLFEHEPELVRLVCDMFVFTEMRCIRYHRYVTFVGPFYLMKGELVHTVPHSQCHHACSRCPRCTCVSCLPPERPPDAWRC